MRCWRAASAPQRPCLGLEGGERPTWRRRRSHKAREEAAPPLGGGRGPRAAQLGPRGDPPGPVVFLLPFTRFGLAMVPSMGWGRDGVTRGQAGVEGLTLRAACLCSPSSCGSTRWSGGACPRRNARPPLSTACGSSLRTMLWPSPGSGTSFLS